MKLSGFLVVKKGINFGGDSARFVKTQPSLGPREISIKLECEIPNEMFVAPQLKFKINVPPEAVPQKEISAEVVGNIQEIIKQNTGLSITLFTQENQD